jgi:hypothetical protein
MTCGVRKLKNTDRIVAAAATASQPKLPRSTAGRNAARLSVFFVFPAADAFMSSRPPAIPALHI